VKIRTTSRGLRLAQSTVARTLIRIRYRRDRLIWLSFCALSAGLVIPGLLMILNDAPPSRSLMSVETARRQALPSAFVETGSGNRSINPVRLEDGGPVTDLRDAGSDRSGRAVESAGWDERAATASAVDFDLDAASIRGWEVREIEAGEAAPIQYFDGRAVRPVKTMTMTVTGYSPDARSCAPFDDGITASGYSVWTNGMKLIAADKRFKFGTLMSVPGYNGNKPTPILDRGAAIKGHRLDLLFPTHEIARQWGRKKVTVTLWEYVDEADAPASAD